MFIRAASFLGHTLTGFASVMMIMHPVISYGQGIVPNPSAPRSYQPGITTSGGGKPTINIVAPNAGVSHNKYQSLNATAGAIFNNAISSGTSQTGGTVQANPNLTTSGSASTIVNEVNGSASSLAGTLEVFGQKADVIIANQNGITCNGCSFINTGTATLSSGAVEINGADVALRVSKGQVKVGRGGLTNTGGNVALVGRHVVVDGTVKAGGNITASGGAQLYQHGSQQSATAPSTQARSSEYAVSATSFGAMEGSNIRIIGNESGLGVKLDNAIKSSASLGVHSKGNLDLANTATALAAQITATGVAQLNAAKLFIDAGQTTIQSGQIEIVAGETGARKSDVNFDGDLNINVAGDFANTAVFRVAGELKVTTGGNITNTAKRKNVTLTAEHDCTEETCGKQGAILEQAVLSAGKGMALKSSGKFATLGANITANNDISISAQGDVEIASAFDKYSIKSHSEVYTENPPSQIIPTWNVITDSQRDFLIQKETSISSSAGNLSIHADGDLRISPADLSSEGELLLSTERTIELQDSEFADIYLTEDIKEDFKLLSIEGDILQGSTKEYTKKTKLNDNYEVPNIININTSQLSISSQYDIVISNASLALNKSNATLIAENDFANTGGALSVGGPLSIFAGRDIINEATKETFTLTQEDHDCLGAACGKEGFTFEEASLKAGKGLSLYAGRDLKNIGSELTADEFVYLQAGNDILNDAATGKYTTKDWQDTDKRGDKWGFYRAYIHKKKFDEEGVLKTSTITAADGPVQLKAGHDISNKGALIQAEGSIKLDAGNDIRLQTASEELKHLDYYKKTKSRLFGAIDSGEIENSTEYNEFGKVRGVIDGNNVAINAGNNILVKGASVLSKDQLHLSAGNSLVILPDTDRTYKKIIRKKSGLFGYFRDDYERVTDTTKIDPSKLEADKDLELVAENGDIYVAGAQLTAGEDINLSAENGSITMGVAKEVEFEDTKTYTDNGLWFVAKNYGSLTENIIHNELLAGGTITFTAGDGITVEYEDNGDLNAALDAFAKSPELAWMAQLRDDNRVQWDAVQAALENWDYKQEGLTAPAAALIALAVTLATAGAAGTAAGAVVSALGIAEGSAAAVALEAALAAGMKSLASRATVSLINNKGDIGNVLDELGSDEALRSLATTMVTAGVSAGLTKVAGLDKFNPETATSLEIFTHKLQTSLINATVGAAVSTAINGGKLEDELIQGWSRAMVMSGLAAIQNEIGNIAVDYELEEGSLEKIIAHAAFGGLAAELSGGEFVDGALAATVAELTSSTIGGLNLSADQQIELQRLITTAALLLRGADVDDAQLGGDIGASLHENNYLNHEQIAIVEELMRKKLACGALSANCSDEEIAALNQQLDDWREVSKNQTLAAHDICSQGPSAQCSAILYEIENYLQWDRIIEVGAVAGRIGNPEFNVDPATLLTGTNATQNLDLFILEAYQKMQSGKLTSEEASRELIGSIVQSNGRWQIAIGATEIAAVVGICGSGAGTLACVAALASGTVAVNRTVEGVQQAWTGDPEVVSAMEQLLIAGGLSAEEAAQMRSNIETGAAVLEIAVGGYAILKHAGKLSYHKLPRSVSGVASGPALCFIAGTPVLTVNGYKNIEDIKVGDRVISRDDKLKVTTAKPVTKLFRNNNKQIYSVSLQN
uniref:two-partner secretion domain-containing protein n=1 Tax=Pseudovibrio sp. POLY-S9 TaxID=1576596 RepID=UPI0009EBBB99